MPRTALKNLVNSSAPQRGLLSISKAAKALQISPDTLRNWEKKGLLTPHRTEGNARRYSRSEITRLQRELGVSPKTAPNPVSTIPVQPIAQPEISQKIDQDQIKDTFNQVPEQKDFSSFSTTELLKISSDEAKKEPFIKTSPFPTFEHNTLDNELKTYEKVSKYNKYINKYSVPLVLVLMLLLSGIFALLTFRDRVLIADNNSAVKQLTLNMLGDKASQIETQAKDASQKSVLAVSTIADSNQYLEINAETYINSALAVDGVGIFTGNLTAPNIVYSVTGGSGITVTPGQNPIISSAETLQTVTQRGSTTTVASTFSAGLTLGNTLNLGQLSSDPSSAINGATYYNTSSNQFRCYINGSWQACDTQGASGITSLTLAASSGSSQGIANGNTITIAASSGVTTTAGSGPTVTVGLALNSNGGLTTTGGLGITDQCADTQVLRWNGATSTWECSNAGGGGAGTITAVGDVTSGAAFTDGGGQGTSLWFTDPDGQGELTIGNITTDRTYTLPDASGTIIVTGNIASNAVTSLTGSANQVLVNGTSGSATQGAITLTLPQSIGTSSTPTFASMTLSAGSNQLTLGTTNTLTVNSSQSTSATATIPDLGGNDTFCFQTLGNCAGGDITAVGDVTSGAAFTAAGTQGTSLWFYDSAGRGQLTIADLSAARTYTLPDASGTIAVSASAPISLSAAGNISCSTCVTSATTLFTLSASSGSSANITSGGTVTIAAGTGISTTGNGSGTVTVANTGVTSALGTANQVNVSGATGAVTFSLPQNIHTAATPTFASLSLTANSNQLTLGTTNTLILTTTQAASRTATVPQLGANDTFCMLTLANCVGTGGGISGSGTTNTIPKFASSSSITDSLLTDDGTTFAINTNKFTVTEASGNTSIAGSVNLAGLSAGSGSALCLDGSNNVVTCTTGTGGVSGSGTSGQITYWNGTSSVTGSTQYTFSPSATTTSQLSLVANSLTTGTGFDISSTGTITSGGELVNLTANSATTGDILAISGTGLTTGQALQITGPSSGYTGTGLLTVNGTHEGNGNYDSGMITFTSTLNNPTDAAMNLFVNTTNANASSWMDGYGIYSYITDSTALFNGNLATAITGYAETGTGGDASIVGVEGTAVYRSMTADGDITGVKANAQATQAISTGTMNAYGVRASTSLGAESTGGTTNVYGGHFTANGDVGAGGTINTYGLYIANGAHDTDGTSSNYGLYIAAQSGADTNVDLAFGGSPKIQINNAGVLTFQDSAANALATLTDNGSTATFSVGNLSLTNLSSNSGSALCISGGSVGTCSGGSNVTGSGTANQITYWSGTNTITGSSNYTFDPTVTTSGTTLALTSGVTSGTAGMSITANSATSADVLKISGTSLTSGSAIDITAKANNSAFDYGAGAIKSTVTSSLGGGGGDVINLNLNTTVTSSGYSEGYGIYNLISDNNASVFNQVIGAQNKVTLGSSSTANGYASYNWLTSASTSSSSQTAVVARLNNSGALGSGSRDLIAFDGSITSGGGNNGGTENLFGTYLSVTSGLATTGSTNNLYGFYTTTDGTLTTGGTITQYGGYIADGTSSTTGTSTKYGLYVEAQTGADTNYGIISAGTSSNVGIGDTTPASLLTVGASDAFQVNSSGNIVNIGGAAHSISNSSGALNIDSATTGAINIGTSANAKTITIGNSTGASALAFNSGTGSQTFTSQVQTGTTTTSSFVFDATAITSGTGMYVTSDSVTTGKVAQVATTGNTLTSGSVLDVRTTSTGLTGSTGTGSLLNLDWSPGSSTTATGDLFALSIGSNGSTTGKLFNILDSGSSIFSVSETAFTTSLPASFTAVGDTSFAYDINFTNPVSANIKSDAPLSIISGKPFNSSDLTLQTYNEGTIVLNTANITGTAVDITNNTVTSGTILNIAGSSIDSGSALAITGPSTAGSIAGNLVSITSGVGNGGKALYVAPDFGGTGFIGYGLYVDGTDSNGGASNVDTNIASSLNLTNNAARTGRAFLGGVTSASTTADTLVGADLTTTVTGIITTGTRSVYGLRSQPSAGAESTGGTTNVYGVYSNVSADVGAGGTVNGYGLYVANGTYDTDGTSAQYGLYISALSGADTNVDIALAGTAPKLQIANTGVLTFQDSAANSLATLTDDGSTATYSVGNLQLTNLSSNSGTPLCISSTNVGTCSGGSNVTGSGTANQITYWSSSSAVTGSSNFTFDPTVTTSGTTLALTSGVTSGTAGMSITANSATSGDILRLTGTSLTSGSALEINGPSGAGTGVTGAILKVTTDIGSSGSGAINSNATFRMTNNGGVSSNLYLNTTMSNATNPGYGYGIYNALTDSTALSNINTGTYNVITNNGNPTSKSVYGTYDNVTASGSSGTTSVYGNYILGNATNSTDAGTVNNYGLYIANGTSSTNGTSTKYGAYIESMTGADTNYALISAGTSANVGIGDTTPASLLTVGASDAFQVNSSGNIVNIGGAAHSISNSTGALNIDSASTGAINIGTSANAKTITIGNNTGASALAFTSGTGSQTFTSSVATTSTTSSAFVYTANSLTSGTGMYVNSTSLTTGKLAQISTGSANTLTSGTLLDLRTTATSLTGAAGTGSLLHLDWAPGSSTTASGDLFALSIGSNGSTTGKLFNILDSGSSIFSVSETAVTTSLPTNFTSSGDVAIAYDLNFTNPTSSYITSDAPLYIQAGETFNSSDLTLQAYNFGSVIVDSTLTSGSGTKYTLQVLGGDTTSNSNVNYGYYGNQTLTGNAGKTGYGLYQTISDNSTSGGDLLYGGYFYADHNGAISSSTKIVYGVRGIAETDTPTDTGGTITTYGGRFSATGATGGSSTAYGIYASAGGADTNFPIYGFRSDDGVVARFEDSNGTCDVNPTSTSLSCSSDRTLKKDINSLNNADSLGKIMNLRTVSFKWNNQEDNTNRYGFIAQEVEPVIPELVTTDPKTGKKALAIQGFTPFIVGAIQELNNKVDKALNIDSNGTLNVDSIKVNSIRLAGATDVVLRNENGQIIVDGLTQTGNSVSTNNTSNSITHNGEILATVLNNQSTQISDLQTGQDVLAAEIASQSAALADSVTSTNTRLDDLSSQIADLLASISSESTESSQVAQTTPDNQPVTEQLTPTDALFATQSAELANLKVEDQISTFKLDAIEATVSGIFKSYGETHLANTLVAGDLLVDGTTKITGNSINSLACEGDLCGILRFQDSPLANLVDFFNGLVTIDKEGTVQAKTIVADQIKVTKDKSAGQGIITSGTNEAAIFNDLITDDSLVIITPESQTSQVVSVTDKVAGTGFVVKTQNNTNSDIKFSYLIIGQK